jgi:outer membrane protein assembly factor BamA
MKFKLISFAVFGASLWAGNQPSVLEPLAFNINSRYTVESVELSHEIETRISRGLRRDLGQLIGEKFNSAALNNMARRIRDELHVRTVTHHVLRGDHPDHVKVVLEVTHRRGEFELSVPKFAYHSGEGWSGAVDGTVIAGNSRFTAGLISDGDELVERYSGLRARYENRKLGTDRLRLRFEFDTYHQEWNRSTVNAMARDDALPGIYRSRQNFEPLATLVLARPLTVSFGMGFERFDTPFPAVRTQSANAVITSVRYQKRIEGWDADQQDWDAGYSLRAATGLLNSDFAYTRHRWEVHYSIRRGRQTLSDEAVAGLVTGHAPLFERYVLGNSTMLRGWNKYDLDPLGGSRLVYNSLDYRYGMFDVFYDTGAIWDPGQEAVARHSVGVGLRKNSFMLALAFPIRGHATPVFMVGMNY